MPTPYTPHPMILLHALHLHPALTSPTPCTCTLHSRHQHPASCTLNPTPCTLHPALSPTPCTLHSHHPHPCTLHPTPCIATHTLHPELTSTCVPCTPPCLTPPCVPCALCTTHQASVVSSYLPQLNVSAASVRDIALLSAQAQGEALAGGKKRER